jgi:hypothetical protein
MAAQSVQVSREEAHKFAQVWRYKGIVILMDDAHLQFATDFANVALQNLLQRVKASQAAKPKLVEGVNEHANVSDIAKQP